MLESRIYVGLHDKDSHEQLYDTETYKSILKDICRNHQAPFSLQVIEGGYYHDGVWWRRTHSGDLIASGEGPIARGTVPVSDGGLVRSGAQLSVQDDPNLSRTR